MRCPHCGATNPDTAQWCGQCYGRFTEPEPPSAPEQAESSTDAPAEPAPQFDAHDVVATEVPAPPAADASRRGFRREGDEILWACPQCDHYNPMELRHCAVCGSDFIDRFRQDEPEPVRDWRAALAMTAVAPGAGHVAVGRYGSGVARLVLFAGWLLGAVLLGSSGGSRAVLVVVPLVLGALVLWAGSLLDVYRLQQGESEILGGRPLLWLVVGVLILMGVGVFTSAPAGGG